MPLSSRNQPLKSTVFYGHIPDSLYDELGFANDLDPNENVVRRDETIRRETYQRAKTLSHEYQRQLRLELKQQADVLAIARVSKANERLEKILAKNKVCEETGFV